MQTEAMAGKYQLLFFTPEAILSRADGEISLWISVLKELGLWW